MRYILQMAMKSIRLKSVFQVLFTIQKKKKVLPPSRKTLELCAVVLKKIIRCVDFKIKLVLLTKMSLLKMSLLIIISGVVK